MVGVRGGTCRGREKKSVRVNDLLGFALGVAGISLADFCALTYDEFDAVVKAYHTDREALYRDGWERVRTEACIGIQPHIKGKADPKRVLPLPWDKKRNAGRTRPLPDREQAHAQFEKLKIQLGYGGQHG